MRASGAQRCDGEVEGKRAARCSREEQCQFSVSGAVSAAGPFENEEEAMKMWAEVAVKTLSERKLFRMLDQMGDLIASWMW